MNPFCAPERTVEQPGPLNPWEVGDHTQYYVSVDHTEQAFHEFVEYLGRSSVVREGGICLVRGEAGCGKTSLVHRCALHAKENLEQDNHRVGIVDLSSEFLTGQQYFMRCKQTVVEVLDRLRTSDFLSAAVSRTLDDLPPDADQEMLWRTMRTVTRRLEEDDCILVVIPPKLDLPEEVDLYYEIFKKARLVLVMETSEDSVREHIERWNRDATRRILHLSVGPLAFENGWDFVQARMATFRNQEPTFDQNAVNEYMTQRTQVRLSVRELERVCIQLFGDAVEQQKSRIDLEDFARLYFRYGGQPRF